MWLYLQEVKMSKEDKKELSSSKDSKYSKDLVADKKENASKDSKELVAEKKSPEKKSPGKKAEKSYIVATKTPDYNKEKEKEPAPEKAVITAQEPASEKEPTAKATEKTSLEAKKEPAPEKAVTTAQEPSKVKEKAPASEKEPTAKATEKTSLEAKKEPAPEKTTPEQTAQESSTETPPTKKIKQSAVKLKGLYAFKLSMSSVYDDQGAFTPVTLLEVKDWVVSQVKTKEKEGYNSVQVACVTNKAKSCSKALKKHLSIAAITGGASHVREIRQDSLENIEVGQPVSIHSIQKGDKVKVQAISKGHGFAGVVKRWDFRGGPASHGAKTHRSSGSIGNRTEPARVMPGKKMAGHYGVEKVSLKDVQVVDIVPEDNLIVLKGPIPGVRKSLVFLQRS